MRLRNIANLGGTGAKLLLAALAVATAALLVTTDQAQTQSTCRPAEHLGTLGSKQTVLRIGALTSSTCYHTFDLAGQGRVTVSVSTDAFDEVVGIGTADGTIFARSDYSRSRSEMVTRVLPAGRYSAIAGAADRRRGGYELRIATGELETAGAGQPESPIAGEGGDGGTAVDGESRTVARGHVIARVHALSENDRRGTYRIEFGFLSEDVLASGADRTAVVQANAHLLPPRRYLNEASMLGRARNNDRSWLRSSRIDVFPFDGDDATLSGEPLLTGRVIARWNPTSGGRFRIEFGFLPEWAFQAAGGNTQRAAKMYAGLLPEPGRYLSESRINSEARRTAPRWLISSLVGISDGPTDCTAPVAITPIAVPLTLPRGERISAESIAMISGALGETFDPVTVTGLPPGLEWDLAETSADGCEHQLTVSGAISASAAARNYSVQITVEGADGTRTPATIRVELSNETPLGITWRGYTPTAMSVGSSVRIIQPRVTRPIPAPPQVNWQFESGAIAICSVNSRTGALMLNAPGVCQITVTASAPGYSPGKATAQVTVEQSGPPPPRINSISCPSSTEVGSDITCTANTSGGRVMSWAWRGASLSGNTARYSARFSEFGWQTVSLTVSNSGGSHSDSVQVQVAATPPPSQYGRCGSDAIKVYWFDRTNYQKRHIDITGEEATRIFGLAWWDTIGHLSQSACNSWPTGARLTGRPPR